MGTGRRREKCGGSNQTNEHISESGKFHDFSKEVRVKVGL
jgi:hypothetical protein